MLLCKYTASSKTSAQKKWIRVTGVTHRHEPFESPRLSPRLAPFKTLESVIFPKMKYEETEKLRSHCHEKRALFGESCTHALTRQARIDHTRYAVGEPLPMAGRMNGTKGIEHSRVDDGCSGVTERASTVRF